MKTKCEKLENNKVKISVDFTKDEIKNFITKKYRQIAFKYSFPGFRKGKAPRPIIDNQFSKEGVMSMVTEDIIDKYYPLSIDESDIWPLGKPDFGKSEDLIVEDGKPFTFHYEIEVEPEYELSNYDSVEIEIPPEKTTEAEIADQIEQFRENYFTYADDPDDKLIDDKSTLFLNIEAKCDDGSNIDLLTKDDFVYHLGSKFLPEEFEKKLLNKKKGDKLEFDLDMPNDSYAYLASVSNDTKKIHFKLHVNKVKHKTLPNIDDQWVKTNIGLENVDDFKKHIKDQIQNEKDRILPILKENKSLQQLAKRLKDTPSQASIDHEEAELLKDFYSQLESKGITFDQYLAEQNITADKFKQDLKLQAKDVCAQNLALDAYARKHDIVATKKDIEDEFKRGDEKYWKEIYKEWKNKGMLHELRRAIIRMKAAKHLVKNAKIKIVEVDKKSVEKRKKEEQDKSKSNRTSQTKSKKVKSDVKQAKSKAEPKVTDNDKQSNKEK